jgi:CheY-like chemotaxis protein
MWFSTDTVGADMWVFTLDRATAGRYHWDTMLCWIVDHVRGGTHVEADEMHQGARILLVDDDQIYVKSTAALLESHGYRVESALNGKEGLAKMAEIKPDLVLLDVMMSWALDGVMVSEEMMQHNTLQRIPIIMVSSIRASEYKGLFPHDRYLHIDYWLDKPCPPALLVSEIEATLTRRDKYAAQGA